MHDFVATRADHERGHVAMAVVPYRPTWCIPQSVREHHNPWACTFHCNDGGPRHFVAFGGKQGMQDAVQHFLGELLQPAAEASHA